MKAIASILVGLLGALQGPARAANAEANWKANCVQCHGPAGDAKTMMGRVLNAKNLTDPKVQTSFTDAEAAKVITEGVKVDGKTRMKAFGDKLTPDEIKALVVYVRSLKK